MAVLNTEQITVIKEVVALSDAFNEHYEESGLAEKESNFSLREMFSENPSEEKVVSNELRGKLESYLKSLDEETAFVVLTTMYTGRDEANNTTSPNELFKKLSEEFKETFVTKERAIDQIAEKTPLSDYLRKGVEVLNGTTI